MKNLIVSVAFALSILCGTSHIAKGSSSMLHDEPDTAEAISSKLSSLKVVDSEVCKGIESHTPVSPGITFDQEVGKVWIYTKFESDEGLSSTIKHVYFFKGKKISEVALDIRGPSFRTFSYKSITEEMVGDWKVEVENENGEILRTLEFSIKE